jgi:predicted aspartyl protease
LGTLIGSVDERLRPLIRLTAAKGDDDVLCLLDTGFNGELLVRRAEADRLGLLPIGSSEVAEFAGGERVRLQLAEGNIHWLGELRFVRALISADDRLPVSADAPQVLVGTRLLFPHLLLIDFSAATVEIEHQA